MVYALNIWLATVSIIAQPGISPQLWIQLPGKVPSLWCLGLAQRWPRCSMATEMWGSTGAVPISSGGSHTFALYTWYEPGSNPTRFATLLPFGLGARSWSFRGGTSVQERFLQWEKTEWQTRWCLCKLHGMGFNEQKNNWHWLLEHTEAGYGIDSWNNYLSSCTYFIHLTYGIFSALDHKSCNHSWGTMIGRHLWDLAMARPMTRPWFCAGFRTSWPVLNLDLKSYNVMFSPRKFAFWYPCPELVVILCT